MRMRKVLVMNGPNLDMLGTREPEIYGHETLEALEDEVRQYGARRGIEIDCFQSNSEGELVEKIHAAPDVYDGIVYNPGAHTHYSYALRDAIASIDVPVVEVHLSDIDEREPFRRISVIAAVCVAQVKGLGVKGYCRAIDILCDRKKRLRLGSVFEQVMAGDNVIVAAEAAQVRTAVTGRGADTADDPLKTRVLFSATPYTSSPATTAADSASAPDPAPQPQSASDPRPQPAPDPQPVPAPQPAPDSQPQLQPQPQPRPVSVSASQPRPAPDSQPQLQSEMTPVSNQASQGSYTRPATHEASPIDFAAAYASAVASVDAGLLSFERQGVVHRACERLGISSLLVRDTSNIHWITALDGVFDEERAHALLVSGGRAYLHTDSRYSNAVRTAASRIGSDIVVSEEKIGHPRFAYNALTKNATAPMVGKLGIEDTITYAEFVKMVECFKAERLAPTSEVILGLRAIKDAGEITRLKAAQAVTDAAFAHIVDFMRPGMTEREVQLELEDYMARHGAQGLAFRSIVAAGPNGVDPHAVPGNMRLEAGQCVVMDFGAKAYGYCSDMTRTVFLGRPAGAMAAAWETLRRANETVEAMLKPGVTGAAAHELAERILEEGGFGGCMGHGLGHGVGIDVHELPTLNPRNKTPLAAGNVVTVEPGIYLPGKFGMRLEDFGVVTNSGFDVFTQSTHEMVII